MDFDPAQRRHSNAARVGAHIGQQSAARRGVSREMLHRFRAGVLPDMMGEIDGAASASTITYVPADTICALTRCIAGHANYAHRLTVDPTCRSRRAARSTNPAAT
jgi:hypothetical protein